MTEEKTTTKKTTKKSTKKNAVCSADVRLVSAWAGGFQAQVTVTGEGTGTPLWRVRWASPGTTVTQALGASLTPDGDDVLLSGLGTATALQAGVSRTFTVVGTASGPIVPAASCGN